MKIEWNKVTTFSKILALILFVALPFVGFWLGLLFDVKTMEFGNATITFESKKPSPEKMLLSQTWEWISAEYSDGRKITPNKPGRFTLSFEADGSGFRLGTDCNHISGMYEIKGSEISFKDMISTKMYCEGSQEMEVASLLENTQSFHFGPNGELIFDLKYDSGSAIFKIK